MSHEAPGVPVRWCHRQQRQREESVTIRTAMKFIVSGALMSLGLDLPFWQQLLFVSGLLLFVEAWDDRLY